MSSDDQQQRRRYWSQYMEEMNTLIEKMLEYPVEESGEPMVSITAAFAKTDIEVQFSDSKIDGELDRIFYIRAGLIDPLLAIARDMNAIGWILKIEDGFRTEQMQRRLVNGAATFDRIVRTCFWECQGEKPPIDLLFRRARIMIANHGKIGTHTQGAAVDISVFRKENRSEVWRGKAYLEMSEYTPMASPYVSAEEHDNRMAITEIMERHRFMHFPGEFWHYNCGDVLFQILTESNQPGIYGPVHLDLATGEVTPYEDPMRMLVPPEQMEQELELAIKRIHSET